MLNLIFENLTVGIFQGLGQYDIHQLQHGIENGNLIEDVSDLKALYKR